MSDAIRDQLADLRRRVRLLTGLIGVGWLVAVGGLAALAAGLADWALRLPPDVRVLLLGAWVAAVGWTAWQRLVRPLTTPLGDVELAIRIERAHPELEERFSSAVEFLRSGVESGACGSPVLVRAAVDEALALARRRTWTDVVQTAPLRRAGPAALVVLATVALLALLAPESAGIALQRLFHPLGPAVWPKRTCLKVIHAPSKVARGESFTFVIGVEKGVVPRQVIAHYRFDPPEAGEVARDPLAPDAAGRFEGVLERVTRPFVFHVECPDDRTPDQRVEVVDRPSLEELVLQCTYPAYTGKAPERLPVGQGHVSAVWGTWVDVFGRTSKPIARAAFVFPRQAPGDPTLTFTERTVRGRFRITADAGYNIRLWDQADPNLESLPRGFFQIACQKDEPPSVFVDLPGADKRVTATARVGLKIAARDDWGLARVGLAYRPAAAGQPEPKPVLQSLFESRQRPVEQVVEHTWDLAPLKLTPGAVLVYWGWATDADDLNGPHQGTSRPFRLLIVPEEQMAQILDQQLLQIRQEVEQLIRLQEQVHGPVVDTAAKLRAQGRLGPAEGEVLQSQELGQRQVEHKLSNRTEGLLGQAEQLLADMEQNRVRDPARRSRVEQVHDILRGLADTVVPEATRRVTEARKSVQAAADRPDEARRRAPEQQQALEAAAAAQREILAGLQDILRRLDKWETYREVVAEAQELLQRQVQTGEATRQVGRQTVGKPLDQLSPEEKVALEKVARQQEQTGQRLGRLLQKMERLADRSSAADPLAAENLREAMAQSRRAATEDKMASAGRQVAQNRIGQAVAQQAGIVRDLEQLLEALQQGRQRELARLAKKLKEAEQKLAELRQRQAALLKENRALEPTKPAPADQLQRLTRQQRQMQEETGQTAQQLQGLRADEAGPPTGRAAARMGEAADHLDRGRSGGPSAQAQEEAVAQLDKALEALRRQQRQVEEQLAEEEAQQLQEQLQQMLVQQTQTHRDTAELDGQKRAGGLTRGQLRTLATLARTQTGLAGEARELAGRLDRVPVFRVVLGRVAGSMDQAAHGLEKHDPGPAAQQPQQEAIRRLSQLIESFRPGRPSDQGGGSAGGQGGGGAAGGGGPAVPPVAQLKLLKTLQEELNEVTRRLDRQARADGQVTPEEGRQIEALAREQAVLSELLREMTQPPAPQ